jgi:hypothetical protein
MTAKQSQKVAEQAQVPFQVAQQIRELLDTARKEYGPEQWDERDIDSEVQTLFEEA